jgi:hypothetical protein
VILLEKVVAALKLDRYCCGKGTGTVQEPKEMQGQPSAALENRQQIKKF